MPPNILREISPPEDTSPANVTKPTEDYEDYGNLTTKALPELYDDLTTTEVPNASTVEAVTRKRLKRRKTTTNDPTTSTRRRLKRTRTTTVGPENV